MSSRAANGEVSSSEASRWHGAAAAAAVTPHGNAAHRRRTGPGRRWRIELDVHPSPMSRRMLHRSATRSGASRRRAPTHQVRACLANAVAEGASPPGLHRAWRAHGAPQVRVVVHPGAHGQASLVRRWRAAQPGDRHGPPAGTGAPHRPRRWPGAVHATHRCDDDDGRSPAAQLRIAQPAVSLATPQLGRRPDAQPPAHLTRQPALVCAGRRAGARGVADNHGLAAQRAPPWLRRRAAPTARRCAFPAPGQGSVVAAGDPRRPNVRTAAQRAGRRRRGAGVTARHLARWAPCTLLGRQQRVRGPVGVAGRRTISIMSIYAATERGACEAWDGAPR